MDKASCGLEVWLQFGHDLSAVETPDHLAILEPLQRASIRPRPFSRGNNWVITQIRPIPALLQFGHDLSAVETSLEGMPDCPALRMLQFGHDLSAVETN